MFMFKYISLPLDYDSRNITYLYIHIIRDLVSSNEIVLKHCSMHEQLADIVTKSLPSDKFIYFRSRLGVCNFESRGSVEG